MKLSIKLFSILLVSCLALSSSYTLAGKGDKGGKPAPEPEPTTGCAVEPIVMVHGYLGSTSNFNTMEGRLQADQPACALYKFGYNSTGSSNKTSASRLSRIVVMLR